MFWGVQIGATDRPTEMDCWSNDSNALTEEVFSRKTFVAIWCAFPYVMMRVRKPPLPVYVCAMPQPQKLVYYPRWMRRKTTRVALRIVILILSSINSLIFFAIILLCYQCRSNIIKGQMSLILWQAIKMLPSTLHRVCNNRANEKESFHSYVEHSNWYFFDSRAILSLFNIRLSFFASHMYETEFCMLYVDYML